MVCIDVAKYHRANLGLNTETKSQFIFSEILCFLELKGLSLPLGAPLHSITQCPNSPSILGCEVAQLWSVSRVCECVCVCVCVVLFEYAHGCLPT